MGTSCPGGIRYPSLIGLQGGTARSGAVIRVESTVLLQAGMIPSLSVHQTAKRLGISRRTVYYWIQQGRLRAVPTRTVTRRVTVESIDQATRMRRIRARAAGASSTVPCVKCLTL